MREMRLGERTTTSGARVVPPTSAVAFCTSSAVWLARDVHIRVLAASLAYQFGLEWGAQRSRSFRFVTIDEAFGRGSDESTRYGLDLFKKLNLQLVIVTPLQKIHVIEPYVSSVGFVHNEDGRNSLLRNLSIEEYRAEQEARRLIKVS